VTLLEYDAQVRGNRTKLDLAEGETIALLGENGAGKSTVLRVIAGLLRPELGQVRLAGREVTQLPPHRREVGLLAQDPLLFPHLSAVQNVAFGPQVRGASAKQARERAQQWLERTGVAALADRKPDQLSGGQAQRVAIARALATSPRLLLLDEPLAALDVNAAPEIRSLLREVLRDQSAIVVTHDALDALLLADRVVVLEHGQVVESGPTQEVLRQPRSAFAAQIAGLNLIPGRWQHGTVVAAALSIHGICPDQAPAEGASAVAVFSPTAVSVYDDPPHGSPRNLLPAVVSALEPMGERIRVRAHAGVVPVTAEITAAALSELELHPGAGIFLSIKATEVRVHPAR